MTNLVKALKKAKMPVIAAWNMDEPEYTGIVMAEYTDPETGVKLLTNRMRNPSSPLNGGDLKEEPNTKKELSSADFAKLQHLATCYECSTIFKAAPEVVTATQGQAMNCVVCGESIRIQAAEDDEFSAEEDEDVLDDEDVVAEDDEAIDDSDEDDGFVGDVEMEDDLVDDSDEGDDDFDSEGVAVLTFGDEDEEISDDDSEDLDNEEDELVIEDDTDEEEPVVEEETEETEEEEEELAKADVTPTPISTREQVIAGIRDRKIGFVPHPDRMLFISETDRVVARLLKAHASENVQPLFEKPEKLAEAIKEAVADPDEDLQSFGLELSTVDLPAKAAIDRRVAAAVAEKEKELATTSKTARNKIEQSYQTALLGVAKNFFKDTKNPLRDSLVASLEKIGVRSAAHVVDSAMVKACDEFCVAVAAKAAELEGKSNDARAEVASLVADAEYAAPVVALDDYRSGGGRLPIMATVSQEEPAKTEEVAYSHSEAPKSNKYSSLMTFR